jgi:signal recognition particle subunit SRP54
MGDILSLAETIEAKVDRDAAEKLEQKLRRGKGFNLADFKMQLEEIAKIGGMSEFLEKMPGANKIMDPSKLQSTEKETKKMLAIINSMTLKERVFPDIIKGSRKRRIAAGSGTQVQDVNRLLKHFEQLTKVMKKMQGGKIKNVMRNLQQSFPKIGNLFGNSLF